MSSCFLRVFYASKRGVVLALLSALASLGMRATPLVVPNGSFRSPFNVGTLGGGTPGMSITRAIGFGPWLGNTVGVSGTSVAPTLKITTRGGYFKNSGYARVSGIANTSSTGIADNGAFFSEDTWNPFQPKMIYTLSVYLSTGKPETLSDLQAKSVGIALTEINGKTVTTLSRSSDALSAASLRLVSGTEYQLTLRYQSGASVPLGQIGINLYDLPTNLPTGSLISHMHFDRVSLDGTTYVPEPSSFALAGLFFVGASFVGVRRSSRKRVN